MHIYLYCDFVKLMRHPPVCWFWVLCAVQCMRDTHCLLHMSTLSSYTSNARAHMQAYFNGTGECTLYHTIVNKWKVRNVTSQ